MLHRNLTITGDVHGSLTGTYIINNENSSLSLNESVYKLEGQDRFIYYSPSEGEKVDSSGETEGLSYFSSKNFIILIKMYLHDTLKYGFHKKYFRKSETLTS